MRNTKRELNPYSFYDTESLARHFERMAAEGRMATAQELRPVYLRLSQAERERLAKGLPITLDHQ